VFEVDAVFPTGGRYLVHTEFRRQGQMTDVLARHETTVSGPTAVAAAPTRDIRERVVDGVRIALTGEAHVGGTSDFHLSFADARTGRGVDDLQPYLGAAGHVVVMRQDGSTFDHAHAETEDDQGRPVFALPGQEFGPELDLHLRFDTPGTYRLWGQFRLADGSVVTAPFTVIAS
jgi:Cu+-exporting ATPase